MKRNKEIKIRVSEGELSSIKENSGGNVANFMRELALGNVAPQAKNITIVKRENTNHEIADPALLRQLSSIGNLLNQATRIANTQVKAGHPLEAARLSISILAAEKALRGLENVS